VQTFLDEYLVVYNQRRPHQGRGMNARTPATAFVEGQTTTEQGAQTPEKKTTKQAT